MKNFLEAFRQAAAADGVTLPATLYPDRGFQRFSASTDKANDTAGFYILHRLGEHIHGTYGDWRKQVKRYWSSFSRSNDIDPTKMSQLNRQMAEQSRICAAEQIARQQGAITLISKLLNNAQRFAQGDSTVGLPYLPLKGFKHCPSEVWLDGETLCIPLYDASGRIVNLQRISVIKDGGTHKRWFPGAARKGCWMAIPGEGELGERPIAIAEGYATAATMSLASGLWTIAAGDANHLGSVALAMRSRFPNAKLMIVADDDAHQTVNVGRNKAEAAAKLVGATVLMPELGEDRRSGLTDINDQSVVHGMESVRATIARALNAMHDAAPALSREEAVCLAMQPQAPWAVGAEPVFNERPVLVWSERIADGRSSIEPLLHANITGLVFGAPDAGKTHLTTRLAVQVAAGGDWIMAQNKEQIGGRDQFVCTRWYVDPEQSGCVLLVAAEENLEEMRGRLFAACATNADGKKCSPEEYARRKDAVATRIRLIGLQDTDAEGQRLVRALSSRDGTHGDTTVESRLLPLWHVIRDALNGPSPDGSPWRLVVLDPLVELISVPDENASSFMSVALRDGVHSLRRGLEVTVLMLHHSRKGAVTKASEAADSIRGSTAILGSVRWGLCVTVEEGGSGLCIAKGNYIKKPKMFSLAWSADHGAWLAPKSTGNSAYPNQTDVGGAERPSAKAGRNDDRQPLDGSSKHSEFGPV